MKRGILYFTSTRLLDQLRECIRYKDYSLQTEKAHLYWVHFFIRWNGRDRVMRHPREMGLAEIEAFLSMLANERQIAPSTHNQALSALLFLYREVLAVDLPWQRLEPTGAEAAHSQRADTG
jgi:Phage integrase, N-terminal SAM-like domain